MALNNLEKRYAMGQIFQANLRNLARIISREYQIRQRNTSWGGAYFYGISHAPIPRGGALALPKFWGYTLLMPASFDVERPISVW